jgi:hypothetical protein
MSSGTVPCVGQTGGAPVVADHVAGTPGRAQVPPAEAVADFLLEITWPREGEEKVYVLRPFELRITPRDSLKNPMDATVQVRLTARFPGEFDEVSRGYFQHGFEINGPSAIQLSSNFERGEGSEPQWLMVYCTHDEGIAGQSATFAVLPHAPMPFACIYPKAGDEIEYITMINQNTATFSWEKASPVDPYHAMRQSESDTIPANDFVRYTLIVSNETGSMQFRYPSDGDGVMSKKIFQNSEFLDLIKNLINTAHPFIRKEIEGRWHVEATDGVYATNSTPMNLPFTIELKGICLDAESIDEPSTCTIKSNTPNPFRAGTNIVFTLSRAGYARLSIHSLLGEEVAILVDATLSPGPHGTAFTPGNLSPGIYLCRLEAEGTVRTRTMLMVR